MRKKVDESLSLRVDESRENLRFMNYDLRIGNPFPFIVTLARRVSSLSVILSFVICFSSCYDDKGNYTYRELNEIEITNIPEEVAVLAGAENIVVTPKVVSKLEGEIKGDNPNYGFAYTYSKVEADEDGYEYCLVLDSAFTKDLDIPAKLKAQKYTCWFEVTDKRTRVVTSKAFTLNVASAITEGWMVLCNEGPERRVRLDMIAVISAEREVETHDILVTLPLVHDAVCIGYDPRFSAREGSLIRIFAREGSFELNSDDFSTGPEYNIDYQFGDQTVHHVIENYYQAYEAVVIDDAGDVYSQGVTKGSVFGLPFNVLEPATVPTFKMSKYVGYVGNAVPGLLLFNKTEQRFMMWYNFATEYLMELSAPDPKLFDWSIGKDLVYMQGTENNYGIYALMKDAQGFSLCGIDGVMYSYPPKFKQALYQENLQAQRLAEATHFAVHPQLPYLFYAVDNEVWQYDFSTRQARRMIELAKGEKVTMIKFNLFSGYYPNANKPDEYWAKQYRLIVGSVDSGAEAPNNGLLRFYDVPELNGPLTQFGKTYQGFGEIVDVVYREMN